ncbi:hypothetical protein KKC08_04670 [Patescibacteria group bacterium]|nr:hypothetical protein [Patescibacteria group bacterium]MCG2702659.1 hypothetical protein [Candidatus Parcubacteria bacterium]MBU4264868.1 hypothetical protein [Patescibacteria group bacterium]MBU4389739.1 hypothetical protein [Patescibacteria group bacterium]MBU4397433.1 hypothetical protein [Patescibacteria group bacterium]
MADRIIPAQIDPIDFWGNSTKALLGSARQAIDCGECTGEIINVRQRKPLKKRQLLQVLVDCRDGPPAKEPHPPCYREVLPSKQGPIIIRLNQSSSS